MCCYECVTGTSELALAATNVWNGADASVLAVTRVCAALLRCYWLMRVRERRFCAGTGCYECVSGADELVSDATKA